MTSYRVCFFNEIPRNQQLFRCCQRSIVIRSAHTAERAIAAAKKRFARLERIRDWKIHAASFEIEAIDLEATLEATPQSPIDTSAGAHRHEKDVGHRARPGAADLAARGDGKRGLPLHARAPRLRRSDLPVRRAA